MEIKTITNQEANHFLSLKTTRNPPQEDISSEETSKNYKFSNKENKNENNPNRNPTKNKQSAPINKETPNLKDFISNKSIGKNIHAKFLFLKRQLNVGHLLRKMQIDSLLKKCKSKAFRNIHEALLKCLKIKPGKLPQLFITNVKIDYNKHYLEKSILEIYQEFNAIKSFEDLVSNGYVISERKKILEDFLHMSLKHVYENYINSNQFKKDYTQISEKEGQNFAILFSYIAQIFIDYYQRSRGNRKKGNLITKNNESKLDSEDSDFNQEQFLNEDRKDENENKEEKNSH